jgi:release factor glutamine methyltransferase
VTPRGIARLIDAGAARLFGSANPGLDADTLFRGVSGLSRASVLSGRDETVPPDVEARYEVAIIRRERQEPIQYILGSAAFWRDEFLVNNSVLIPRPETEILVEAVAARLRGVEAPLILDVGTGSGCIALSLLRESPDARVIAVDVSEPALTVARQNAERLGLESRTEFRTSDWLEALRVTESFEAIVSNPPYVARADKAGLPPDVREFEPSLALFADAEDVLSSYRAILDGLEGRLKPGGLLAFEVGLGQAERVADLIVKTGLAQLEILNDLASIPRVVLARRP